MSLLHTFSVSPLNLQSAKMEIKNVIKIAVIEDLKEVALELKELFNEVDDMSCLQVYHTAEEAMAFLPKNPRSRQSYCFHS